MICLSKKTVNDCSFTVTINTTQLFSEARLKYYDVVSSAVHDVMKCSTVYGVGQTVRSDPTTGPTSDCNSNHFAYSMELDLWMKEHTMFYFNKRKLVHVEWFCNYVCEYWSQIKRLSYDVNDLQNTGESNTLSSTGIYFLRGLKSYGRRQSLQNNSAQIIHSLCTRKHKRTKWKWRILIAVDIRSSLPVQCKETLQSKRTGSISVNVSSISLQNIVRSAYDVARLTFDYYWPVPDGWLIMKFSIYHM